MMEGEDPRAATGSARHPYRIATVAAHTMAVYPESSLMTA